MSDNTRHIVLLDDVGLDGLNNPFAAHRIHVACSFGTHLAKSLPALFSVLVIPAATETAPSSLSCPQVGDPSSRIRSVAPPALCLLVPALIAVRGSATASPCLPNPPAWWHDQLKRGFLMIICANSHSFADVQSALRTREFRV